MRNISGYFKNPFTSRKINFYALSTFAADHLDRMKARNPGGVLDARIAATAAAVVALDEWDSTDGTKVAQRLSLKKAKRDFRRQMRQRLGKLYWAVLARYGEKSPEIKRVFPKSRTRVARERDDTLKEDLTVIADGLAVYAAELGANVVAAGQTLLAEWTAVFQASEGAQGAQETSQRSKREARAALQLELFRNLLAIAALFPDEPEKLSSYMQKSLLRVS